MNFCRTFKNIEDFTLITCPKDFQGVKKTGDHARSEKFKGKHDDRHLQRISRVQHNLAAAKVWQYTQHSKHCVYILCTLKLRSIIIPKVAQFTKNWHHKKGKSRAMVLLHWSNKIDKFYLLFYANEPDNRNIEFMLLMCICLHNEHEKTKQKNKIQ